MKRRHNLAKKRIHKQTKRRFEWANKIDIFKYLSLLLIFIFLISVPFIVKKLIKINKVICSSQFDLCADDLNSKLQVVNGYDYYLAKKYIDQLLTSDISIRGYLVQYKIPSTIKVDLTIKKPKFAIKSNETIYLVDKDGTVISTTNQTNLPIIISISAYEIGKNVDFKTMFALSIYEKVAFLYNIKYSEITESDLKITTNDNINIWFPLEGDVDLLVGSLRLIFSRLNDGSQGIRMEDVHEVDLRYTSPVLR